MENGFKINDLINQIQPMDLNCEVFSVYDYEDLTIQELLNVFFTKITQCVETSNSTLELSKWLVDKGLKQVTAEKLTEWYNNGELAHIITTEVLTDLDTRINDIKNGKTPVPSYAIHPIKNYEGNWADAINKTIQESNPGDVIFIPPCRINKTIVLKGSRTYIGGGWGQPIVVEPKSNLVIAMSLEGPVTYNTTVRDICIDGSRGDREDTWGTETGFFANGCVFSNFINIKVFNTKGTGIYLESNGENIANTNRLENCFCYDCGGYGLYIHGQDNHVFGGQFGANKDTGVHLLSASSSVRGATIWGNKTNGVYIHKDAPAIQLWNNQIEGNAENGIYCCSSFCQIDGNKIYDNANMPQNYKQFDGIYICGERGRALVGVSITNNKIFSGIYGPGEPGGPTGIHRRAISIDMNHDYFYVKGNDIRFQDNGKVVTDRDRLYYGIKDTDITDIELVAEDRIKKLMVNLLYPVGIILDFSKDFNPNNQFPGTTWKKIEGRFKVSQDSSEFGELGKIGGESKVLLTVNEIPSHTHMGCFYSPDGRVPFGDKVNVGTHQGSSTQANFNLQFNNGYQPWDREGALVTGHTGESGKHENLPPYVVVQTWKRTA